MLFERCAWDSCEFFFTLDVSGWEGGGGWWW